MRPMHGCATTPDGRRKSNVNYSVLIMLVCNLRARSGIQIWPMEESASTPCYSVQSTERSSILRGLLRKGWLAECCQASVSQRRN